MNGVILAGGKNTRMGGKKKWLLELEGKTILEKIIDVLRTETENILIVTNSIKNFSSNYKFSNVIIVEDIYPDKGPIGGIYTGLLKSEDEKIFVVASDMPFLNGNTISFIKNCGEGYDACVIKLRNCYYPLYSYYSKNCLSLFEEHIKKNELSLKKVFKKLRTREICGEEWGKIDLGGHTLFNINTPDDYEEAKRINIKLSC